MSLVALVAPSVASANTLSLSGSMEGSVRIANGDHVAAGYSFTFPGGHPEVKVLIANAKLSFSGNCSNGGTGTLTIPLRAGDAAGNPYVVPANSSDWFPSGDERSAASYQGSVVASVCGGSGTLDASRGATFTANIQADQTANAIHIRFHYRDPNAKGKGNYDCSASNYASDVCGASWSGTASLTPDSIPPSCPSGTTKNPDGTCTPVVTCPAGTTKNPDGTCTPVTTCPAGTTKNPDGTCTPVVTCPAGTTLNANGTCTPVTTCPAGTSTNPDGTCTPVVTCPAGTTTNANGTCTPVTTCPAGTTTNANGTCTPVTSCPDTTTMNPNGTCTPVTSCPSGTSMSPSGSCMPPVSCPSGSSMTSAGTCVVATSAQKPKAKKQARKKKVKKHKHHNSRKPVVRSGFTG